MNLNQPIILKEGKYSKREVDKLKKKDGVKVVDIYFKQLKELFEINNPQLLNKKEFKEKYLEREKEYSKNKELLGDWIYYSWSNILLHAVSEKDNDTLKTNRNRDIITKEEQDKLRQFTIAIAGLSVGSNIATTLLYNGFPKNIKIADFDVLETTNLNRIKVKLSDVGLPKTEIISKQLYEIDPYVNVYGFENGINKENIKKFLLDNPRVNLIFEIIDDLKLKILIRKEAKKNKIPVVMLTSIGDSVLIDIERYDINPETKIFNGLVDEKVLDDILSGKVSKEQENKYVAQIVGLENIPQNVMDSIKNIGKSLVGRPQIMSAITVESGIACYIARKIALVENIPSGRNLFSFHDLIKF